MHKDKLPIISISLEWYYMPTNPEWEYNTNIKYKLNRCQHTSQLVLFVLGLVVSIDIWIDIITIAVIRINIHTYIPYVWHYNMPNVMYIPVNMYNCTCAICLAAFVAQSILYNIPDTILCGSILICSAKASHQSSKWAGYFDELWLHWIIFGSSWQRRKFLDHEFHVWRGFLAINSNIA